MSQVDKEKLRTVYLRKRKMLTPNEQEKRNAKLFYFFSQFLDEHEVKTIHTFLSIEEQNEVDTWVIVKYLKALEYDVIISKANLESNDLTHFRFENRRQLEKNKWGIFEPISGQEVSNQELDMVLVPLIVNDKKGHRIGYGKGYYDKFLSKCPASCIKVGLSLSPPLDEIMDIEPHDVQLNYCISHLGIHQFDHV